MTAEWNRKPTLNVIKPNKFAGRCCSYDCGNAIAAGAGYLGYVVYSYAYKGIKNTKFATPEYKLYPFCNDCVTSGKYYISPKSNIKIGGNNG